MYDFKMKFEPFGRGFVNCESEYYAKRLAAGYIMKAKEGAIEINPKTGLLNAGIKTATGAGYGDGPYCSEEKMASNVAEHPEFEDEFKVISECMKPYLLHQHWKDFLPMEERLHHDNGDTWGGTWIGHSNPNFHDLCIFGTDALREKIEYFRAKNPGKDDFYDSIVMITEALDIYGARFSALASEMLEETDDEATRRRLTKIVDTLTHAPQKPCLDFAEAVIVFTLIFTLDGIDSPGHFDQYMYGFWKKTDEALREEYLEYLWEFFHDTRTWNLCISGSDENWNDLTNDLSYAILELTARAGYQTPNLTMRTHRNTPEKLLRAAQKCLGTGCGIPALYNDEIVCPALEKLGIPPEDSHQYVMNGCNQIDIQGKSHMGLEDGEVFIAKAVELVLHRGVSQTTGDYIGIDCGDPKDFHTFDDFMEAFFTQLDHLTDICISMSNRMQKLYSKSAPNPLRCLLIEGCMEKGIDYKSGGPLYCHGQILEEGIADAIDSLTAIKKYVYDDKKYTMAEVLDAMDKDYEGYDDMYYTFRNSPLKFGNDIEYVDSIGKEVMDHFHNRLQTYRTFRGGIYAGGCSTFNRTEMYGKMLGTLPNGHKFKDVIIADSIGAVPGCDVHGPTALLKSCMSFDQSLVTSGFVLNLKFDKTLFNSEAGADAFISLVKTYFAGGGQQIQVNVVSAEELIDAKAHPERHGDLIVRVGGYSDYFTRLSEGLQDNIIKRTCSRL